MGRVTGFIGLGSQGGPMAERMLEAGHPLIVWARRPEAATPFVQKGARMASSVAELDAAAKGFLAAALPQPAIG